MKKELKFSIFEKIENIEDIPGNHPEEPKDRGFLYLQCNKSIFEDSFNDLFEFNFDDQYACCFLSENCEITHEDGRRFCCISFKGDLWKDKICELLKNKLNNIGIIFAEILNNVLILENGEKIPLNQFAVEIYEYE